ncbi:MAG TPA: hypothetical protein EYQ27_00445 [Gemmatimonadetes bacterium]|nr:hypothetical protein [Gemmatimonadota bacterium]
MVHDATLSVMIYLIRHGQTAYNAAAVIQPADTPLNERGLDQADRLAARLGALGVAHVLASDLPRAVYDGRAYRTGHRGFARTQPATARTELRGRPW